MEEDALSDWQAVLTPAGEDWSGRTRYAAAMSFYLRGEMSAEILEIYRICSRIDAEDPLAALRAYRIGRDWILRAESMLSLLRPDVG